MTLADLTTARTVAQVRTSIYTALEAAGLAPATWKPGSPMRGVITGLAIVISALSQLQAAIAKGGLLDTAEGDWLKILALGVYGVEKLEGTHAVGTVRLTNNGGGVYAGAAGDLVVQNPTTKKTYQSTGAWSLSAGAGTVIVVPVQAVEAGASISPPGTITALVTVLTGVTVTNDATIVGTGEETDAQLRQRCRDKLGSLSANGPSDAYAYAAKTARRASDGTLVGINRVRTIADGVGGVAVVVADPDGPVSGSAGNPATDLGAVQKAIEGAAPYGVTATASSAIEKVIAVSYELWVHDVGELEATIETDVAARLAEYLSAVPIGGSVIPGNPGTVYRSGLAGVIGTTRPNDTINVVLITPVVDIPLEAAHAPSLGVVTATIHRVPAT